MQNKKPPSFGSLVEATWSYGMHRFAWLANTITYFGPKANDVSWYAPVAERDLSPSLLPMPSVHSARRTSCLSKALERNQRKRGNTMFLKTVFQVSHKTCHFAYLTSGVPLYFEKAAYEVVNFGFVDLNTIFYTSFVVYAGVAVTKSACSACAFVYRWALHKDW